MAITDILLRTVSHADLTTKNAVITWTEEDQNFIEIYESLKSLTSVDISLFETYNAGTTYENGDYVSYSGNIYRFINVTPTAGITPGTDPLFWELASVGEFAHEQNKDQYLDFGGANQVSVTDLYALLNGGVPIISDIPYDATSWNANLDGATKNSIRDKFVTVDAAIAAINTTNLFANGGNSFGATAVLGTNDERDLNFETFGTSRGGITSAGKWMMGVTTPFTSTYFSAQSQGATSATNAFLIKNSTPFDISWLNDSGELTVRSTTSGAAPVLTLLDNSNVTLFQVTSVANIIAPGSFLAADSSVSFSPYNRAAYGPLSNQVIQYNNYLLRDDQATIAGDRLNWKFGFLLDGGTVNLDWLLKTMTGDWSVTTSFTSPTVRGSIAASGNLQLDSTSSGTKGFIYLGASSAYNDLLSRLGVGTQAPAAKIHSLATTEQLRAGYDTSNYFSTTVSSTGSVTLELTGTNPRFTLSKPITFGGSISSASWVGVANSIGFTQTAATYTDTTSSGAIGVVTINAFAANTFNTSSATTPTAICNFYVPAPLRGPNVSGGTLYGIVGAGETWFTAGLLVSGITTSAGFKTDTTAATSNFNVAGGGAATSTTTSSDLLFGGAAQVRYRAISRGTTFTTASVGDSYASWIFGTQGFTEAASGTHALAAQAVFKAISITAGAATTTNTATVYIEGAATGGTNNYALWVDAGMNRLDGNTGIGGIDPTAYLHLAAGTATGGTAPEKNTSGTLNTVAEPGAKEYNGSFYQTKASGLRYGLGGVIFESFADVGNGTTVETDLQSYTTPASTLAVNGGKINANYGGTFVASGTATRQLKVYFAGTAIFDSGAITIGTSSSWDIKVTIIRVSSSVIRYTIAMNTQGASLSAYTSVGELTGLTLSNTNILKITGQAGGVGAATNDIVLKLSAGEWKPAAAN